MWKVGNVQGVKITDWNVQRTQNLMESGDNFFVSFLGDG